MSMLWEKQGLVIKPDKNIWWMKSYAGPSFVIPEQNSFKIFVTGRDDENRSRIGIVEVDKKSPFRILNISPNPIIEIGRMGCFDEKGTGYPFVIRNKGKSYLYYSGWAPSGDDRFKIETGLAISSDNEISWEKYSEAPIPFRDNIDPITYGGVFIIIENGVWKMWYGSFICWKIVEGKPKHFYHIRYAESTNGVNWKKFPEPCIDFKDETEYAIAKPMVTLENNVYKMWYSYRGDSYKIGYAESRNGIQWERKDELCGIHPSESGWDSEMICYPYIIKDSGKTFMFYNGNGYGRTGLGMALLK